MELRIRPVVQVALAIALMAGIGRIAPAPAVELSWLTAVLATGSLAFLFAPAVRFSREKTTVDPVHPERAERLVTGGLYRVSRNPMYVGMALLLGAVAAWGFAWGHLAVIALFIWWMTRFHIIPEERALEARFGEEYRDYKANVRRWV
ncbi:isoprenylcysteine carboxylmethyltransferase family protein [Erythrobacter sp.]|uniref:methyltransferase family protein n=1 Tax=Erythrobacter sp. TaxID=1042 RepID=UPI001425CE41|nr:isoprenylcysteine carboxylmethyltransferase family protein [Erythrobacter sp.]QIQ86174.1 MAG: isoprenylcysteine carboxylmethyltransferase family protein [Erythrobacter sp.]